MTTQPEHTAPSGRRLSDEEINRLADDVASTDYDVEQIRRRGRPSIGTGPAQLVPVRLDPELLQSLRDRAQRDHATNSEVIRAALRDYLAS
ncbi:MAG: ribbon-helix-helix domain-containing protein [Ilumatobacteraceae bacterium]